MEKKDIKVRHLYLDVIKLLACFLVVVNHTNSFIFLESEPSPTWVFSVAYFFVSKIAVPLFIMCSGAALLGRDEPYKKVFGRIARVAVVLLVSSLVYYIAYNVASSKPSGGMSLRAIPEFFATVIQGPVSLPLWYLYMYAGILVMLPILRKLTPALEPKDYRYFLFWAIVFLGIVPMVGHYKPALAVSNYFSLPIFGIFISLFVAGYYIHAVHEPDRKSDIISRVLPPVMLVFLVVATYFEYLGNPADYLYYDNVQMFPLSASSICVFYLIKRALSNAKPGERALRVIEGLGGCTFGIYLTHSLFIRWCYPALSAMLTVMHEIPAMLVYQIIILLSSLATTFLLRLIPGVKRFI